ncbi:IS3 family transposase [Arthrobacter sp. CJ23]|uniref:IS3 family transposase n=1 Tax=Arthrobacter sp. CJ23 TaxID=2972479 RepID=UPI00215CD7D7|nr:IS3 family transposase [Arthrobacter sp. CJ23]UVJ41245.1 IS3 family transposase [Arthrobacter sp. CJ23]
MFHRVRYISTDALAAQLNEYIRWYNTERISTKLEGLSRCNTGPRPSRPRILLGQSNFLNICPHSAAKARVVSGVSCPEPRPTSCQIFALGFGRCEDGWPGLSRRRAEVRGKRRQRSVFCRRLPSLPEAPSGSACSVLWESGAR